MTDILTGARFRIRDCWPFGLRFLTMHLTPWTNDRREMACGALRGSTAASVWTTVPDDDRLPARWSVRLNAGHATKEGKFAPSLEASGRAATLAAAREAVDSAILGWFRERIADGSVLYPWPAVEQEQPTLFGGGR